MEIPELKNPFTNARIVSVNTDPKEYHDITGAIRGNRNYVQSNTSLKLMAECQRKWILGAQAEKTSDATDWGIGVHCLTLTPEYAEERIAVTPETYPDTKTGEPKPWTFNANFCKDWKARNLDKLIVKPDELAGMKAAVRRLMEDDPIAQLINSAQTEVFVQAEYFDHDTVITVPIKGLIDLVPNKDEPFFGRCLADVKTLRNGKPSFWQREVFQRGYHIQAALYLWLYTAATGEDRTDFLHVLSENVPPYEPGRRLLTNEYLEMGRRFIKGALRHYCQCLTTGIWPDYDYNTQNIRGWTLTEPEAWMIGREPEYLPIGAEPSTTEPTSDPNDLMP